MANMTNPIGAAAAAAAIASPIMASAEKRQLQAMLDSVKQIAHRYPAMDDELSHDIRETVEEISRLIREGENVATLQRAFVTGLQELLVDSAGIPLGEEAFLGSDGACYSKETIDVYKVSGDRLRGLTPTGAEAGAEGFSVKPHSIVREIASWMKFHHIAVEIAPHIARLHRDLTEAAAGTGELHDGGGAAAAHGGAGTGEAEVESDDDELDERLLHLRERQFARSAEAEDVTAAAVEVVDPTELERTRRLEALRARQAARVAADAAQEAADREALADLQTRMAAAADEGLAAVAAEREELDAGITRQIAAVREENTQLLAAMNERLDGLNEALDALDATIQEETAFLNRVSASVTELERQQAETRRALAELEKKRKERKKRELINTIVTVAVVVGCAIATWYMGGTNLPFLVKMIPSAVGATVSITMGSKNQHAKAKEQSRDPGSKPGSGR